MSADSATSLSGEMNDILSKIAVEFVFNSSGWDSTEYANAGLLVVSSAITQHVVTNHFQLEGAQAGAAGAAVATVVSTLLNDHELNSSEFIMLGVQAGVAAGVGVASGAIASSIAGSAIGTAIGLSANVIAPVIGVVIGLVVGEVISSVYKGKKFYEGEFGDKGELLDRIYKVEDIETGELDANGDLLLDANGDPLTVKALVATNTTGSTILLESFNGISYAIGSSGADILVGADATGDIMSGGAGNDIIYAGGGDDYAEGGEGLDVIYGQGGNDIIMGSSNDEEITGDDGNDIIDGGAGLDTLSGNAGDDIFVFSDLTHSTDSAQDIIEDFAQGEDLIDLTAFSFTSISDFTVSEITGQTVVNDNSSTFSFKLDGSYTIDDNDFLFA